MNIRSSKFSENCQMINKTTVYGLSGPDGKIRYVGQTRQPLAVRLSEHIRRPRGRLACWLKSLTAQGEEPRIFIIERCAVRNEAERRLIAWYRRHGANLVNLTDGGDGAAAPRSAQHRAAIAAALRGVTKSACHRAALSASLRGIPLDPTRAASLAEARRMPRRKRGPLSEEHKEKIRAANVGRAKPAGFAEKISAAKTAWWEARHGA